VKALAVNGKYDTTIRSGGLSAATARVNGSATFVDVFDESIPELSADATLDRQRLDANMRLSFRGRTGTVRGAVRIHPDETAVDLLDLALDLGSGSSWRMAPLASCIHSATVRWDYGGIAIAPVEFIAGAGGDQRFGASGSWR